MLRGAAARGPVFLIRSYAMRFSFWTSRRNRPGRRQPQTLLNVEQLDQRCLLDAGTGAVYTQTALVSDVPGLAPNFDKNLQNPWGFSETPDGQFRVSANASGLAPIYNAEGEIDGRPITIPVPPGGTPPAAPNGNIRNTTNDFVITEKDRSAPATVLFSTEDGTIVGFNRAVDKTHGIIAADLSQSGAVFKLLAAGTANGANFLYATDFHNGVVDVFDKNFNVVTLSPNQFTDPNIPAGFAPFGVKNINGTLFVTYAKQDAAKHDDVEGVGNGFIDEFDTSGHFLMRFASQGTLNSPIGMAVAPDNFGKFSNALLVGNFGDSRVNAFDFQGHFLGQLSDAQDNPLVLNGGFQETNKKGLWGIAFGNGEDGAATNSLFFAAGINAEKDGLFGKVTVAGEDFGHNGVVVKAPHFYEDYVGPKLAQLNAVAAAGELLPNGNFLFVGVNQGAIDPNVPATYVFGIDRSGTLSTGPFPGRPDIRFDALVVIKLVPGTATTATLIDLTGKNKPVSLPANRIFAAGHEVAVIVSGSALPSTGLPPSQYRFDYWPEDGQPGSTHIASFAPEFNDAQVGVIGEFNGESAFGVLDSFDHRHRR
jgi:uncharacterized protein (TIGR03118 family)